ncbi:hypothetical protein PARA125_000788 [Parachlamydia sp. AcF125]|nr:hypothetical protein [Parachlamydia sp. AcF125]
MAQKIERKNIVTNCYTWLFVPSTYVTRLQLIDVKK